MADRLLKYGIASYVSDNILIIPFQTDFYVEVLHALRQEILSQLYALPELKGVIVDVSQVSLMDVSDMAVIEEILKMALIYGAEGFLVGLNPMVALVLVELGYDGKIKTALTIKQAIQQINQINQIKETTLLNEGQEIFDVENENLDEESEDIEADVAAEDRIIVDSEVFEDI